MAELPDRQSMLARMSSLMTRFATGEGACATSIPRLSFIRYTTAHEPMPALYTPCFCLITQGRKAIAFGGERLVYDPARFVVASVDVPVTGVVLDASSARPYLCVMLELEPQALASLLLEIEPGDDAAVAHRGLFLGEATTPFVEAVWRLMRLLETPDDIRVLAPLVEREVLYHLLRSDAGDRLRQVVKGNGHARRIARAIAWLRNHFHQPLRVAKLAESANMSVSSFHARFKQVTAMSPLQYQKQLRLQEARRLLLSEAVDAATAGHRVGYESPSQFSREYRRAFGAPPGADIRSYRDRMAGMLA